MFRIIRYIFLFFIIMFCLFLLQKKGVNVRADIDKSIENIKSFFLSIKNAPAVSPDVIYNHINSQDYTGSFGTSTATTVKAFTQDGIREKNQSRDKYESDISIDGIIYYTNIEREKVGLKPLVKKTKLNTSATQKIDDMFSKQYFEHISPEGKTVADLVKALDYKFQVVGENLALGIFNSDKALVQAWMNSPTHRANILNPKYTEMGASVGISEYKGQKQWMAVQHFAKPMPLCTEIDENVQRDINTEKTILELDERELQKMAGVIESTSSQDLDKNYLNTYNEKVNNYNQRLNRLRITIDEFNKTVVEYNTCNAN